MVDHKFETSSVVSSISNISRLPWLLVLHPPYTSSSETSYLLAITATFFRAFAFNSAAFSAPCLLPMPTAYQSRYSGVPAMPKSSETVIRDLSHVPPVLEHLIYASYTNNGKTGLMTFSPFSLWPTMAGSTQIDKQMAAIFHSLIHSSDVVAPTPFYFRPRNT
jgi:hypothetical protein